MTPCLPNFVFGRSFPLYAVFRKHWRATWVMRPRQFLREWLKGFHGVAAAELLVSRNALSRAAV
jgi:hypothetical protein